MKIRNLVFVLSAMTLGACAYRAQVISLHATLPASAKGDPAAASREVILVTHDSRPVREIGHRAGGLHDDPSITTDTDVVELLQSRMTDILAAKGFRAVRLGAATLPTLRVDLTELSYKAVDEAGSRKVKVQAVLEATTRNKLTTYRKTFQANQERKIVMEPVGRSNEEWINETFSDALKQLIDDPRVYSSLQ